MRSTRAARRRLGLWGRLERPESAAAWAGAALVSSAPILFNRRGIDPWGVAMNDLIDRLRVSAEPVGKLLLEAADALQSQQMRIAELTETLRAVIEIGNSQRSREFADVKKTLAKARGRPSAGPGSRRGPTAAVMAPHTQAAQRPAEIAPVARAGEAKPGDEEIVTGMYKEIQNLLRHSA